MISIMCEVRRVLHLGLIGLGNWAHGAGAILIRGYRLITTILCPWLPAWHHGAIGVVILMMVKGR